LPSVGYYLSLSALVSLVALATIRARARSAS
jgi:hypothetical protein